MLPVPIAVAKRTTSRHLVASQSEEIERLKINCQFFESRIEALILQCNSIEGHVISSSPELSRAVNKMNSRRSRAAQKKPEPSSLLKAMWKRAAKEFHPDRGGTVDQFNEARALYEQGNEEELALLLDPDPIKTVLSLKAKLEYLQKLWDYDYQSARQMVRLWEEPAGRERLYAIIKSKVLSSLREAELAGDEE